MSTINRTLTDSLNERLLHSICDKCGARLELKCPNKHCTDCGVAISGEEELCLICTRTWQTMRTVARNVGWLDDEPSSMPEGIGI